MPELMPSLSGKEKKFIETFNSPKISQCSKEDIEKVLKLAFVRIGLRGQNLPNELEKQVLLSEVLECYGNLTIGQLNQSFELLTRQELDIESTAYENFSIEYLHKVVKSYLRWSSKVYKENEKIFNKIEDKPTAELPPSKLSNEEIVQLSREIYASTKNLMFIEPRCYELLKIELSETEKNKIKTRAIMMLQKIYEHDKKQITDKEIARVCKKIAVAQVFDN